MFRTRPSLTLFWYFQHPISTCNFARTRRSQRIPETHRSSHIEKMLLLSPEDIAVNHIKQAMTALIQANRSLLAQELRLTLQKHIHNTAANGLYPSWLKHGTFPPQNPGLSAPGSGDHALNMTIDHLFDACTSFASAGMVVAARSCTEFSARVMMERSPPCNTESAGVDDTGVGIEDLNEGGVDSWWGM